MKKIVLIYGLIAGAIVSVMMMITMPFYESGALKFDRGEILGYSTMVVALSLTFFGIKSYRDNQLQGNITFGKGLRVGLLITVIASLAYAISWEITYNAIMKGDFIQMMADKSMEKLKSEGVSEAKIAEAKKQMADFALMYKNPFIRFTFTFVEIAWVGVLISLLSAALLRKKRVTTPSQATNN